MIDMIAGLQSMSNPPLPKNRRARTLTDENNEADDDDDDDDGDGDDDADDDDGDDDVGDNDGSLSSSPPCHGMFAAMVVVVHYIRGE